jgi:F0F1-type ATP synthase membrane subunit c/vacuolar-type H+-ATPase subunit K
MSFFDETLRTARILHLVFLVSIPFYVVAGEMAHPTETREVLIIVAGLAMVAASLLLVALFVRRHLLGAASDTLRFRATDAEATGKWRAANILSFVLAETIAIFGLVVRVLGGTLEQAGPFYVAGLFLLILWTPRRAY